jgi:hypothetical protein
VIILLNVHVSTGDKRYTNNSFYEELECLFNQLLKYHMKILFGDVNAKVGREDIFKPTIGNENLHEFSNDNRVKVVNFATPKSLIVKSTLFPHCNIHKYTWAFDEETKNQTGHNLIDERWHSSEVDV